MIWRKLFAILLLFTLSWLAFQAMENTVATGKALGMSDATTLGTYFLLHGILFALACSPLLMLPLFLNGAWRDVAVILALSGILFAGQAGYWLAENHPAYHLEHSTYRILWEQRNAI